MTSGGGLRLNPMTTQPSPADVAIAYIEAFGRGDMTTAATYLADDVVFESPRVRLEGRSAVVEAVSTFAQAVQSVTILATFGDPARALVMYDMHTGPFGPLRATDLLVVTAGKITSDTLVFDTHPIHEFEAAHPS